MTGSQFCAFDHKIIRAIADRASFKIKVNSVHSQLSTYCTLLPIIFPSMSSIKTITFAIMCHVDDDSGGGGDIQNVIINLEKVNEVYISQKNKTIRIVYTNGTDTTYDPIMFSGQGEFEKLEHSIRSRFAGA